MGWSYRSAISIYYGELEGWFPNPTASGIMATAGTLGNILTMENGKYIKDVPDCNCPPYHPKGGNGAGSGGYVVLADTADETQVAGSWGYEHTQGGTQKQWGEIWVNCTHTDTKGSNWGAY